MTQYRPWSLWASVGLALALGGCTTTIAGAPVAVGASQRTTESETSEQTEEETSGRPAPTLSSPSSPEGVACEFGADAFPSVGLLVGLAIFEENSELVPVPTETRESAAQVLDAVLVDTQPMLDALPPGVIRDAFTVSRTESANLRDAMRAPPTGPLLDTVDDAFIIAYQGLQTACQTG